MQAIQIRYLPATDHHGARIKAFGQVGFGPDAGKASMTEGRDLELNPEVQAKRLAERFCWEWYAGKKVAGFGELPGNDTDWVATLENRYSADDYHIPAPWKSKINKVSVTDLAGVAEALTETADSLPNWDKPLFDMDRDRLRKAAEMVINLDCSNEDSCDEFTQFVSDNDTVVVEMIMGALDAHKPLFNALYPDGEKGDYYTLTAYNRADRGQGDRARS